LDAALGATLQFGKASFFLTPGMRLFNPQDFEPENESCTS
jgi:hypothetical protein